MDEQASVREAAIRELIAAFEQRSSSATADLFREASRDLSTTKKVVYGWVSAFAVLITSAGGWAMDALEEQKRHADMVIEQARRIESIEHSMRILARNQETLSKQARATESIGVDIARWLGAKIEAKRPSEVRAPASLRAAMRRVEASRHERYSLDDLPE